MLNIIWLGMMLIAIIFGVYNHTIPQVVSSVTTSAKLAFNIALGLGGIMVFWLGLLQIAQQAGLIQLLAKVLKPLLIRIFPDVPAEHPAMGAMVMNMAANMLGLNNAATPFGLKAMNELESLNPNPGTATNAMCTFLAINTSSIQLIPATTIAFLAAGGANNPTAIIVPALIATSCSTAAGLISVKLLEKLPLFAIKSETH